MQILQYGFMYIGDGDLLTVVVDRIVSTLGYVLCYLYSAIGGIKGHNF